MTRRSEERLLPLQPLLDAIHAEPKNLAIRAGYSERSGTRWARDGVIRESLADTLAIRLELHPVLIWSDW